MQVLEFIKDQGGALVVQIRTDNGATPRFRLASGQIPPALQTAITAFELAILAAVSERLEILAERNQSLQAAVTAAEAEIVASIAAVNASGLSAAAKTQMIALFDAVQADLDTAGP